MTWESNLRVYPRPPVSPVAWCRGSDRPETLTLYRAPSGHPSTRALRWRYWAPGPLKRTALALQKEVGYWGHPITDQPPTDPNRPQLNPDN